jgi:hypothetical protein
LADGRKQDKEYGVDDWADWCDANMEEYVRILAKASKVVSERIGNKDIDSHLRDDMIDAEMRRQKTDFVRTNMKKSIRTYTHKLLNKAAANIEATSKGKFGLGIYAGK